MQPSDFFAYVAQSSSQEPNNLDFGASNHISSNKNTLPTLASPSILSTVTKTN